jgi:hypothetical protein
MDGKQNTAASKYIRLKDNRETYEDNSYYSR